MLNLEIEQPLQIKDAEQTPVCDYSRYKKLHFSGSGEPVSKLNPDEEQEYYILLRKSGVPKRDVIKAVERVEKIERLEPTEAGADKPTARMRAIGLGAVRNAIQGLHDLIRIDNSPQPQTIPVREDIVVFERKHS